MNRGTFKLSTIHSFKGWESPVLFLVIEDNLKTQEHLVNFDNKGMKPLEFSDELVYTGLKWEDVLNAEQGRDSKGEPYSLTQATGSWRDSSDKKHNFKR